MLGLWSSMQSSNALSFSDLDLLSRLSGSAAWYTFFIFPRMHSLTKLTSSHQIFFCSGVMGWAAVCGMSLMAMRIGIGSRERREKRIVDFTDIVWGSRDFGRLCLSRGWEWNIEQTRNAGRPGRYLCITIELSWLVVITRKSGVKVHVINETP